MYIISYSRYVDPVIVESPENYAPGVTSGRVKDALNDRKEVRCDVTVESQQTPWWELKDSNFFEPSPADDFLHPDANAQVEGDSVSETQYFGFNIAEKAIYGICYLWYHPNLGVVSGGAWVMQGVVRHNFQSPIFDFVTYQNDSCLGNDLYDVCLSNGYRTNVIEPLKRHRIRYADNLRGNRIDIEFEALMPPALTKGGLHFEQGMRAVGTVTLGGEEHAVDCFSVRDRSWGAVRPENHQPFAPFPWMNCAFGDDLVVACTALDTPGTNPEWEGALQRPVGDSLIGGWVWRDGELVAITSVTQKRTSRDFDSLLPTSAEVTLVDGKGRDYDLRAEILAGGNWRTWMNFDAAYCLARWELNGRVSYGDFQEVQGADYVRRFMGRPPASR